MKKFVAIFVMMFMVSQSVYATELGNNSTDDVDNEEITETIDIDETSAGIQDNETSIESNQNAESDSKAEQLGTIVKPPITDSVNTSTNIDSDIDLDEGTTTTNINDNTNTNTSTNIDTDTSNTSYDTSTSNEVDAETQADDVEETDNQNYIDEKDDYNPENANQNYEAEEILSNEEEILDTQKNNNKTIKMLTAVLVGLGLIVVGVSVYLTKRKKASDKEIDAKLERQRELLMQNIPNKTLVPDKVYEVEKLKDGNLGEVYIATNNIGEIDDYINQLENANYSNKNVSYYHKGIQAFDRGDYEEAEKLFLLQIEYNYYVTESYMYLMEIHIANKDYDGALEEINKILMQNPNNEQAITIKMEILTNLKRYNECVLEYTELIAKDDDRKYEFLLARGMCKMVLGKYSSAIHDYDMVIANNSANAEAYFNRGLANMVMKNNEKALKDIKLAVSIDEYKYGDKGNMLIAKLEGEVE